MTTRSLLRHDSDAGSEVGVHARNETCAGGDALQHFAQGVSFDGRKWRCDRIFQGVARLVEVGQQTARLVGECDRECAAIIGMGCAFDKSVGFERVDDAHHRVAVDAKSGGELTLGLAVLGRQRHQHGIGPGFHPSGPHPALKLTGDVRAELGQQKRDAFIESVMPVGRSVIQITIAPLLIITYSDVHE
jgi:hypothetical protein